MDVPSYLFSKSKDVISFQFLFKIIFLHLTTLKKVVSTSQAISLTDSSKERIFGRSCNSSELLLYHSIRLKLFYIHSCFIEHVAVSWTELHLAEVTLTLTTIHASPFSHYFMEKYLHAGSARIYAKPGTVVCTFLISVDSVDERYDCINENRIQEMKRGVRVQCTAVG